MKPKTIYLIRHGETDLNKQGLLQGSGINAGLNETGWKQAAAFFEKWKHVKFDKVYTSELIRAQQSVKGFIDAGIPWEQLSGLNEINWGDCEGKSVHREENPGFYEVIDRWALGDVHLGIANGESPVEVMERQKGALETILSRPEEETILICMHGRAIRVFLCLLLNYELKLMDMFEHRNLCLYKLNYSDGVFSVELSNHI